MIKNLLINHPGRALSESVRTYHSHCRTGRYRVGLFPSCIAVSDDIMHCPVVSFSSQRYLESLPAVIWRCLFRRLSTNTTWSFWYMFFLLFCYLWCYDKLENQVRDDEHEREYTGCFEGPEKTLEVRWKPSSRTRLPTLWFCLVRRMNVLRDVNPIEKIL